MIFGDPHKFAILAKEIPEWTLEGSYITGLFHFIVDSKLFPDYTPASSLGTDIGVNLCESSNTPTNALISQPEDALLFNMPKEEAFTKMLNAMLPYALNPDADVPCDFEEDYRYRASTPNIEDAGCYVFAVSFGSEIRVLGAKIRYLAENVIDGMHWEIYENIDVYEAILPKKEILEIVNAVNSNVRTQFDEISV